MDAKRTGYQAMSWIDITRACDIFGLDEHEYRQRIELKGLPTEGDKTRISDVTHALQDRVERRAENECQ